MTQTFATTAGHAYHLSLVTAEQQGDDPSQQFLVELTTSLGGYYSFYISNLTSHFMTTGQDFFPNGVSTILKITDATPAGSGSGSNLALDAVSVTDLSVGAVPEPTIWAMLISGFGVVGFGLRRNKARAKGLAYA